MTKCVRENGNQSKSLLVPHFPLPPGHKQEDEGGSIRTKTFVDDTRWIPVSRPSRQQGERSDGERSKTSVVVEGKGKSEDDKDPGPTEL